MNHAATTRLEAEKLAAEDAIRHEMKDKVETRDLYILMDSPAGRRFIRRLLGPELTNYWGHNCEARAVGCHIARLLDTAVPGAMKTLFEKQEEDEHGWS